MEQKAMRFIAPSGATFALLHVAPLERELLYSPDPAGGRVFHAVIFKTISGFHGTDRIDTRYKVTIPGFEPGELRHVNGVITFGGQTYRIDHEHRTIDSPDIL